METIVTSTPNGWNRVEMDAYSAYSGLSSRVIVSFRTKTFSHCGQDVVFDTGNWPFIIDEYGQPVTATFDCETCGTWWGTEFSVSDVPLQDPPADPGSLEDRRIRARQCGQTLSESCREHSRMAHELREGLARQAKNASCWDLERTVSRLHAIEDMRELFRVLSTIIGGLDRMADADFDDAREQAYEIVSQFDFFRGLTSGRARSHRERTRKLALDFLRTV